MNKKALISYFSPVFAQIFKFREPSKQFISE